MDYIFSHKRDCDGLMSAAIYLRANPSAQILLIDYYEHEIANMLNIFNEIMLKEDRGTIVITDFMPMESVSQLIISAFSRLKDKGWRIVWIDHHQWRENVKKSISDVAEIYINTSYCASELMRKKFGNDDKIYDILAEIGKDTDFHLNLYPISLLLTDIITFYNYSQNEEKLKKLVYKFAQGILWDYEMNRDWKDYMIMKKKAINELKPTIVSKKINNYIVSVGFSSKLISYSEALDIIMERDNSDLGVVVFPDGSLILRRKENTIIKCNKIAEFFEGGGHLFIAGGILPKDLRNKYERNIWQNYVLNKISEALKVIE
ncbi:MAG: hypothetical protein QW128_01440 [Thermoprotei archaeon]